MKHLKIPLLIIVLTIISCGRPVTDDCEKKSLNMLCRMLYNEEAPQVLPDFSESDNHTRQLEAQVEGTNTRIEAILLRLELLESGTTLLTVTLADVIADIISLNILIENLDSNTPSFLTQFMELNSQLTNITSIITTLSQGTISELVDLCDNHKEILIRLGDGSLIALYGGKNPKDHRLQVITPGDYTSTDGEKCDFTVHSDLTVTW